MDFVDSTIVALADETTRAGVFDAVALEQLLDAAYDTEAMGPLGGTFAPLFDELELGYAAPQVGVVEGGWSPVAEPAERSDARFRLSGLATDDSLRVDAVWRGSILARYAEANDRIVDVSAAWPAKEAVDAEVAAAHGGSLPSGAVLEQERKDVLLSQVKGSLHQPAAFTADSLDALRRTVGATSIGGLLDRLRDPERGFAQVVFPDPAPVSAARRALPVAVALLIRNSPISVAQLLFDSKLIRDRLLGLGVGIPKDESLRQRQRLLVTWVVPVSVFVDAGWPGQNAAARRLQAGKWLAREGIGLVAK